MKTAIIDMDSVAFSIGNPNKVIGEDGKPMRTEDDSKFIYEDKTEDELIDSAKQIFKDIIKGGKFTHYLGFIKGKNTIGDKKLLIPDYKGNRPKESPKWWNFVKKHLIEEYSIVEVHNIEVDDAVNIARLKIKDSHICAIDSDLLGLPGVHYNWRKHKWMRTSELEFEIRFWTEMITGTHNNVKGLKDHGPKAAEKLFTGISALNLPSVVFNKYINILGVKEGIHEFYKNYKVLTLLETHPEFEKEIKDPIKINYD